MMLPWLAEKEMPPYSKYVLENYTQSIDTGLNKLDSIFSTRGGGVQDSALKFVN